MADDTKYEKKKKIIRITENFRIKVGDMVNIRALLRSAMPYNFND